MVDRIASAAPLLSGSVLKSQSFKTSTASLTVGSSNGKLASKISSTYCAIAEFSEYFISYLYLKMSSLEITLSAPYISKDRCALFVIYLSIPNFSGKNIGSGLSGPSVVLNGVLLQF